MKDSKVCAEIRRLEGLIAERDKFYMALFAASKEAVAFALTAQEKAVSAAFSAAEKAILKAEQAQKEYNERSNEFRGQLDDQAKTLMPRPETLSMFKALEEKLVTVQAVSKGELDGVRLAFQKDTEAIASQVSGLQMSRSAGGGMAEAQRDSKTQFNWLIGTVIALMALAIAAIAHWVK